MNAEDYLELLTALRQEAPADHLSLIDAEVKHVGESRSTEQWHSRGSALGAFLNSSSKQSGLGLAEASEVIERSDVNLVARRPSWGSNKIALFNGDDFDLFVDGELALLSKDDKVATDWEVYDSPWLLFQ